jgi:hypothetical protein
VAVYPNGYRTAQGFLQNYTFLGVPALYCYNAECGTGAGSRNNRFIGDGGLIPATSATPHGYGMDTPFPPIKAGGISSTKAGLTIDGSAAGTLGVPIDGAASFLIDTNTPAGQLIVSGTGTATLAITPTGNVIAALFGGGSSVMTFTTNTPAMDAQGWAIASGAITMTTTLTSYAVGSMEGSTVDSGTLTSTVIADAVWSSLAANFDYAGTMGNKLNSAASAGDPWGTSLPGAYAEGTAGFKLGNLSSGVSGTAAINTVASGFVLTTGIETNTYTDTVSQNGTYHVIDDVGNSIDCYYEFDVGSDGYPVSVSTYANLQSGNDTLTVYAWNWGASEWRGLGTLPGTGGAGMNNYSWDINDSQGAVGTGADSGKVRIRFAGGSSNPRLDIDVLRVGFAVVSKAYRFIGLAQGGGASTITFPTSAVALDDYYFPGIVVLRSGTGAGQAARINSYAGSTRIATVATPWTVQPDATTIFTVETWASVRVTDIESTPATDIASAVIAAATTTPIAANIKKVNDIAVNGVGTSGNPWGP